ncbi:MAG: energy-coupling factor transporter transmembrane component T [Micrococcales bacterium]
MQRVAAPNLVSRAHPASWWVMGLSAGMAATLASNSAFSIAVCTISISAMLLARGRLVGRATGLIAIRFYLLSALIVVLVKVALRAVFGEHPIDAMSLATAAGDGLKVSAILLSAGAANTLSDPRKLLRSTPPALKQLATAITIALNLAPQLITSFLSVRRAAKLRGRSRGLGAFKSVVIPTLTDALEGSIALATSMESRGFGRRATVTKRVDWLRLVLAIAAVAAIFGAALILTFSNQVWLSAALAAAGMVLLGIHLRSIGRTALTTRYEVGKFAVLDWCIWSLSFLILLAAALVNSAMAVSAGA